jgi:nucleoside-diphosphate-sugar epimerase
MTRDTVLVTGARGFLGGALLHALRARGHPVVAATRNGVCADFPFRTYDLEWESLPPDLFDGVRALVHCALAHSSNPASSADTNVRGGQLLFARAKDAGVRTRIFVSSLAAHEDARSWYGRSKYALEHIVEGGGGSVVRPGLIVGRGGLFARIAEQVRRVPIVPIVDGGMQPLQTVYIDDLTLAVALIVESGERSTYTIAEAQPVAYREFLGELALRLGVRPLFVPVPFGVMNAILALGNLMPLELPVDRDNLLGLKYMKAASSNAADLLGRPVLTYRDSLAHLFPN